MDQSSSYNNLKEFIDQCKARLKTILERLDWTEEDTLKNFNTNSVASSPREVLPKPSSPNRATYPDSCISRNSLVIETPKLQEILQNNEVKAPQNFRELQANFAREQKLKIYEHVIENTTKIENNTVEEFVEGEISVADILAQKKREEKCKKRRFRKSKPTYIEEVRCLIELQMQAFEQFMGNKMHKEQTTSQSKPASNCSLKGEDTRKHEDYYKRKRNSEINNDASKRHRSRSKRNDHQKNKRHKRSSSKEVRHARRYSRSRSKERRKQRERSNREIHHERTARRSRSNSEVRQKIRQSRSNEICSKSFSKRSKERKRHRSRSYEKHTKDHHKKKRDYGSPSYQKHTQRQETKEYLKSSIGRENAACQDYSKQKYHRTYNKESRSPKNSSYKQTNVKDIDKNVHRNGEYGSTHRSKSPKVDGSLETYKYLSQYKETSLRHENFKHKRRKRGRDRS